jgi:16S rRNA processing protein RimM
MMHHGSSWVAVGKIRKPFGLKGEVAVEPLGGTVERLKAGREVYLLKRDGERRRLIVAGVRILTKKVVLSFEGIDTVDGVEGWQGCRLEMPEAELPGLDPDQYYFFQLLGLEVVTAAGRTAGRVKDIQEGPAQPLLVVTVDGEERLIPFAGALIQKVDLTQGRIHLADVEGLLEP